MQPAYNVARCLNAEYHRRNSIFFTVSCSFSILISCQCVRLCVSSEADLLSVHLCTDTIL